MPQHIRTFRSKKLHPEHVKLINEAIRHNAKGKEKDVHITYRKENGEVSERKVRPLAVKGKSLFVAHCHERNNIRSFRVERIQMVKRAFWEGFEKRSYDYAHEVGDLRNYYKDRSKETPYSKTKGSLVGAGIGGVGGALFGALAEANKGMLSKKKPLKGALAAGGIGAGVGGLLGLLSSITNKSEIEEAKRISKMSPKNQRDYLAHLARNDEISTREWERSREAQRRHDELMDELRKY